jgi:hypothetical protein
VDISQGFKNKEEETEYFRKQEELFQEFLKWKQTRYAKNVERELAFQKYSRESAERVNQIKERQKSLFGPEVKGDSINALSLIRNILAGGEFVGVVKEKYSPDGDFEEAKVLALFRGDQDAHDFADLCQKKNDDLDAENNTTESLHLEFIVLEVGIY